MSRYLTCWLYCKKKFALRFSFTFTNRTKWRECLWIHLRVRLRRAKSMLFNLRLLFREVYFISENQTARNTKILREKKNGLINWRTSISTKIHRRNNLKISVSMLQRGINQLPFAYSLPKQSMQIVIKKFINNTLSNAMITRKLNFSYSLSTTSGKISTLTSHLWQLVSKSS